MVVHNCRFGAIDFQSNCGTWEMSHCNSNNKQKNVFYPWLVYAFLTTMKSNLPEWMGHVSLISFHKRREWRFSIIFICMPFKSHDEDDSFAWKPPEHTTASATGTTTTTTTSSVSSPTKTSFASWNGTISHFSETKSGLPSSQSPTVTLLQKSRGTQPPFICYMSFYFVCQILIVVSPVWRFLEGCKSTVSHRDQQLHWIHCNQLHGLF